MKRASPYNNKLQDDDVYGSPDNSSNNFMEEELSPLRITRNDSLMSDTDSLSDSSRKIRKKRNTYQKIPDDIRVQLLDAVKNGETLKSAAKRHKINYSSAKSILHTFRKEGRILKKSAQERTTKKKTSSDSEFGSASKSTKSAKKENVEPEKEGDSLAVLERTKSEPGHFSLGEKQNTASPRGGLAESSFSLNRNKSYEPNSYYNQANQQMQCNSDNYGKNPPVKPFSAMESENAGDGGYDNTMDEFGNKHRPKVLSQFAVTHFENTINEHDNEFNMMKGNNDGSNFISFPGSFPGSFDNFNDITNPSWSQRPAQNDQYHHYDNHDYHQQNGFGSLTDVHGENTNSREFEDHGEHNTNFHNRSFLDTQKLLSEVMGKASLFGYNTNDDSCYRKGSMDFFS